MKANELSRRGIAAGLTAVALIGCVGIALGQGTADSPGAGSLAGVTAELRQLRIAIEESARTQAQSQALSVYVSAQNARVVQAAARAEAARRELEDATNRSRELTTELSHAEDSANQSIKPEVKAQMEAQARALKAGLESLAALMQQAQARHNEAAQAAQFEEQRWNELVAKLEAAIK
jgi:uncharacterized protein (DUF39 family)